MKKFKLIALTIALVMVLALPALAEQVDVYQDNQLVKSVVFRIGVAEYVVNGQTPGVKMDVSPFVQNDRTFVPVRFLGYALGLTEKNITWDDNTQTAKLEGKATLQMSIGKSQVVSNGEAKAIDVAPVLKSDRTFLPARYVAEGLGYQVEWDENSQTVVCWPAGEEKPDVSKAIDYLVEQNQDTQTTTDYTDINGYKVPTTTNLKIDPCEEIIYGVEISILIGIYGDRNKSEQDLSNILLSKFDSQTINDVIAYVRLKQTRNCELSLKKWVINERMIEVASLAGDTTINILVRKS